MKTKIYQVVVLEEENSIKLQCKNKECLERFMKKLMDSGAVLPPLGG